VKGWCGTSLITSAETRKAINLHKRAASLLSAYWGLIKSQSLLTLPVVALLVLFMAGLIPFYFNID
jgi:hypothetical protein